MLRAMIGFHEDAEAHWVAELACGHQQHVRHQPPFTLRPWVLTAQGRTERLGQSLECGLCDRRELPPDYVAYKRTPTFSEADIPAGLLRQHKTKPGVWGLIHVSRGALEYVIEGSADAPQIVTPGDRAVVLPEIEHHVAPRGEVEFLVEFWRRPPS
jgi:tellurite resistance-related uncharacterized protein